MADALITAPAGSRRLPLLAKAAVATIPFIAWSRDIAVVTLVLAALGLLTRGHRWREVPQLLTAPEAVPAWLFIAWSGIAVLWAPHFPWETWLKTGTSIVVSILLAWLLHRQDDETISRAGRAVLWAGAALASLLLVERLTNGFLIGLHRSDDTVFQRLTTLTGGLVLLCTTSFAYGVILSRYLGALIALPLWICSVLVLCLLYPMDAEGVAMLSGAVVFMVVLATGRKAAVLVMMLLGLGLVGWGFFAESAASAGLHRWLMANVDPNWGYRVEIWRYVSELIEGKPLMGYGFDASRVVGQSAALMPSFEGKTSFLHPHNGMLQVWLELGGVGVLLLLGAAGIGLRAVLMRGTARLPIATTCATITTTAVLWSLSFGVWQGWWLAVLGLTAASVVISTRASQNSSAPGKRILFLATEFYLFDALKKEVTEGARNLGYEIVVAARCRPDDVKNARGITLIPFPWKRSPSVLISMFYFLPDLVRVGRVLSRVQPDILHNIALKPAVIGSLAAIGHETKVVNAIHGFGFLFTRRDLAARAIQTVCGLILKLSAQLNTGILVLINRDDLALTVQRMGVPEKNARLIHGTGIDLGRFTPQPEPTGPFTFLVIGRLLYMKGIDIAVEAHSLLRKRGVIAEMVICGSPDPENPSSIPESVISEWAARPGITFTGQVADIRPHLAACHALVHPSLGGEGLPRALSEAAATERALIATDIPGNREVVIPHKTGLLVCPGDAEDLATAMQWMIEHAAERRNLAKGARDLIESEFASAHVRDAHSAIIRELDSSPHGAARLSPQAAQTP